MSTVPITVVPQSDFHSHPLLARLLELHKVPKEIHIQGNLPEVTIDEYGRASPRILTVIGSRKATSYGRNAITSLLKELKGNNIIILSGLALGIDGLSHKNALENNLITLSVPGSGLDSKVLYPKTHVHLRDQILECGGAMISELPNDTPAAPWTFPNRNRIMAALSDALLVVEAEELSGTLITARLALELGKDIGAIPGEIFSPTSQGTNNLIREGAYPITSTLDIFNLLHLSETKQEEKIERNFTYNQKTIIKNLNETTNKDDLFLATKLSFEDFLQAFSLLEIEGIIQEEFGEVRRLV